MSSPVADAPIRFVIPARDMLQSLYNGSVPHNAWQILNTFKSLDEFNKAGPVQIAAVEGHGGALPQYDVMNGRYPLRVNADITEVLHPSIPQRPLIRGPFGVSLNAKHYDDLKWTLEQMAEAGGAKAGHQVVFKLFEAQNRPAEYLDSLRAITELKKAGYNVGCEVAMVVSDKPDLNISHYQGVADSLLNPRLFRQHGIDPSVVVGFSLKDMIGGIKATQMGHDAQSINAQNLTLVAMKAIESFGQRTGQSLYLGLHAHEIGNAVDSIVEAGATFAHNRRNFPHVTEFQQDAIMGSPDPKTIRNFGFADLEAILDRYKALGLSQGMSAEQKTLWDRFKANTLDLAMQNAGARIDASAWNKDLLEYGQLASGGLPFVESNGIKPFLNYVANNTQDPSSGSPVGAARAGHILRGLFASVNGLLAADLGNAHSVTPAMKFLNVLAINVMGRVLQSGLIQERVNARTDWSKPMTDEAFKTAIRAHYDAFNDKQAMAYFSTPMPTPVAPAMLNHLRTKLFDTYFPESVDKLMEIKDRNNSATMLQPLNLDQESYARLRGELRDNLLDKQATRRILTSSGVPAATAQEFADAHIGVNEQPINYGVKARLDWIRDNVVKFMEKTGGVTTIRRGLWRQSPEGAVNNATFSATLMRPRPGELLANFVTDLLKDTPFRRNSWQPGASAPPANKL